jgi:hypothetical protein
MLQGDRGWPGKSSLRARPTRVVIRQVASPRVVAAARPAHGRRRGVRPALAASSGSTRPHPARDDARHVDKRGSRVTLFRDRGLTGPSGCWGCQTGRGRSGTVVIPLDQLRSRTMRSAVMSVLRNVYPVYRPILSRLGLLDYIARKYPPEKRLHGYIKHYERILARGGARRSSSSRSG